MEIIRRGELRLDGLGGPPQKKKRWKGRTSPGFVALKMHHRPAEPLDITKTCAPPCAGGIGIAQSGIYVIREFERNQRQFLAL